MYCWGWKTEIALKRAWWLRLDIVTGAHSDIMYFLLFYLVLGFQETVFFICVNWGGCHDKELELSVTCFKNMLGERSLVDALWNQHKIQSLSKTDIFSDYISSIFLKFELIPVLKFVISRDNKIFTEKKSYNQLKLQFVFSTYCLWWSFRSVEVIWHLFLMLKISIVYIHICIECTDFPRSGRW